MSNKEQKRRSALDHLMLSAKRIKKKHPIIASPNDGKSGFFPCPAGCGQHVSERDVNVHLDKFCSVMGKNSASDEASFENDNSLQWKTSSNNLIIKDKEQSDKLNSNSDNEEECLPKNTCIVPQKTNQQSPYGIAKPSIKQKTPPKKTSNEQNAFLYMMKQSAKAFNNSENIAKHKFHLHHDRDGKLATTWISDHSDAMITMDEAVWSATVAIKKIKPVVLNKIVMRSKKSSHDDEQEATTVELEVSSSIPFQQSKATDQDANKYKFNFVQHHSRLSVPHLKSILQKSIRRRAPLPSVRVAMELADRSFSDLIRRLPIIILEDSFLHDDFDFLVWLMVAESKGYVPSTSLMVRVFQIVFEMASCPRRDECSEQIIGKIQEDTMLSSFSLTTPASQLFPSDNLITQHSAMSKCETLIRSMLLRAQYGGMACDVTMLHSYASLWLQRYQSRDFVPVKIVSGLPTSKILNDDKKTIHMRDLPRILHGPSREKSEELITHQLVTPGGLAKLTEADVCMAGIDFHCSPVVESLLSQTHVYASLCEKLSSNDRELIASQVKSCIWNYSSGVNRRRTLVEIPGETTPGEETLKAVWETILKSPFDEFTKKFVRQRLA